MLGVKKLPSGKFEVVVGFGIIVVPTLSDAIRLRFETLMNGEW